jgi:hypothetical protein
MSPSVFWALLNLIVDLVIVAGFFYVIIAFSKKKMQMWRPLGRGNPLWVRLVSICFVAAIVTVTGASFTMFYYRGGSSADLLGWLSTCDLAMFLGFSLFELFAASKLKENIAKTSSVPG